MSGTANCAASLKTQDGRSTEVDQIRELFSAGGFAFIFGLAGMLLMIWPVAAAVIAACAISMAIFAAGRREGNSGDAEPQGEGGATHRCDRRLLSSFPTPAA